jgi:hypothetical protein
MLPEMVGNMEALRIPRSPFLQSTRYRRRHLQSVGHQSVCGVAPVVEAFVETFAAYPRPSDAIKTTALK